MLTIRTDGDTQAARQWVEGPAESEPFALKAEIVPMTRSEVARAYLRLGYTHILPKGTDHILFVLGIFLLSIRLKPILLQVTAFTVAHTITLALTIYGVVSLPPRIVEPLIALSIVYVAVENVLTPELRPWRVALVFGFGLLHGMGFAGVLAEQGLPRSEFLPALLCFNAGVELGQLSVIAIAFLLVGLPFRDKPWYRQRIVIPGSILIAAIGLFWFVQRLVGMAYGGTMNTTAVELAEEGDERFVRRQREAVATLGATSSREPRAPTLARRPENSAGPSRPQLDGDARFRSEPVRAEAGRFCHVALPSPEPPEAREAGARPRSCPCGARSPAESDGLEIRGRRFLIIDGQQTGFRSPGRLVDHLGLVEERMASPGYSPRACRGTCKKLQRCASGAMWPRLACNAE